MLYNELSDQQQTTLFKVLSSLSPARQKALEALVSKSSAGKLKNFKFEDLKKIFEETTSSGKEVDIKAIVSILEQVIDAVLSEQSVGNTAKAVSNKIRASYVTPRKNSESLISLQKEAPLPLSPKATPNQSVILPWAKRFEQLPLEPSSKDKLKKVLQRHSKEEQKVLLQFFEHADKRHQTAFLKALAAQKETTIQKLLPWFIAKHKQPDHAKIIKNFIQDPKNNSLKDLRSELMNCIGRFPALRLWCQFFGQL